MGKESHTLDPAFIVAFRAGTLTREQAEAAVPKDRSAMIFMMLSLSAIVAGAPGMPASGANTPSGSIPPYAKEPSKSRKKSAGRKWGTPENREAVLRKLIITKRINFRYVPTAAATSIGRDALA